MSLPGDTPRRRTPRRGKRTVFRANEQIRLSELDLSPPHSHAFSAGHIVALLHAFGLLHGDLHGAHCLFSVASGTTSLIDVNFFDECRDIEPGRMVKDFVIASMSMDRPWLVSMVAGYLKTSYLVIDPRYPGYTEALLELLGGQVVSQCRPAEPVLTNERIARLLTPALDHSAGRPSIAGQPGRAEHRIGESDRADAALVLCGLLVAGVDCMPLLDRPEGVLNGIVADDFIRACLRSHYHGEPVGPRHPPPGSLPQAVVALLGVLGTSSEPGRPAPDRLGSPSTSVLRALAGRLAPSDAFAELRAAITDVCDWLAAWLLEPRRATETAAANSIRLAQTSLMVLQQPAWPVRAREAEESKITARHRHLSWYADMLAADPTGNRYPHLLAYADSRVLTYRRLFLADSGAGQAGRNRLWSANWRALSLARTVLRRLLEHIRSREPGSLAAGMVPQAMVLIAAKLGSAASDNVHAAMEAFGPTVLMPELSPVGNQYQYLVDELSRVAGLVELVRGGGFDLAEFAASETLHRNIDLLESPGRYDFDEFTVHGVNPIFWKQ